MRYNIVVKSKSAYSKSPIIGEKMFKDEYDYDLNAIKYILDKNKNGLFCFAFKEVRRGKWVRV